MHSVVNAVKSHVRVFNFTQVAPSEVSSVLKHLNVGHYMIGKPRYGTVTSKIRVLQGIENPPADVVVLSVFDMLDRLHEPVEQGKPTIVFGCFPQSLLAAVTGDIESFDTKLQNLDNAVRWCLYEGLKPATPIAVQRKTPSEYLEEVSPPSFLDRYQTVQCKITPYSLRTVIHKLVIGYLSGKVSLRELRKTLATSLKFDPLKALLMSEHGVNIKKAVAEAMSGRPTLEVAERYHLDSFEITFITHSYQKLYKENPPCKT